MTRSTENQLTHAGFKRKSLGAFKEGLTASGDNLLASSVNASLCFSRLISRVNQRRFGRHWGHPKAHYRETWRSHTDDDAAGHGLVMPWNLVEMSTETSTELAVYIFQGQWVSQASLHCIYLNRLQDETRRKIRFTFMTVFTRVQHCSTPLILLHDPETR
jgi:hypothetical protein